MYIYHSDFYMLKDLNKLLCERFAKQTLMSHRKLKEMAEVLKYKQNVKCNNKQKVAHSLSSTPVSSSDGEESE